MFIGIRQCGDIVKVPIHDICAGSRQFETRAGRSADYGGVDPRACRRYRRASLVCRASVTLALRGVRHYAVSWWREILAAIFNPPLVDGEEWLIGYGALILPFLRFTVWHSGADVLKMNYPRPCAGCGGSMTRSPAWRLLIIFIQPGNCVALSAPCLSVSDVPAHTRITPILAVSSEYQLLFSR